MTMSESNSRLRPPEAKTLTTPPPVPSSRGGRLSRSSSIEESPRHISSRRSGPLYIGDDDEYRTDMFATPYHYRGTLKSVLIPKGLILDRVEKLAQDIREDYGETTIHLLCVLKGGSAFFKDLLQALRKFHAYNERENVPFTFDFIRVKSYDGMVSSGTVNITGADLGKLAGKHCLLIEDIIDTGLTMSRLVPFLQSAGTASVRVASLLEKRTPRSCGFKADYVGFSIPDKFVIGYCLDYNEVYRDMEHICVINAAGIEKFRHADDDAMTTASTPT